MGSEKISNTEGNIPSKEPKFNWISLQRNLCPGHCRKQKIHQTAVGTPKLNLPKTNQGLAGRGLHVMVGEE